MSSTFPPITGRVVRFAGMTWDGDEGRIVRYVGSQADAHGLYTVLGLCNCPACREYDAQCDALGVEADGESLRFSLAGHGIRLDHVRAASLA